MNLMNYYNNVYWALLDQPRDLQPIVVIVHFGKYKQTNTFCPRFIYRRPSIERFGEAVSVVMAIQAIARLEMLAEEHE